MEATLSTADAARLAGVGPTSVKRWADEGLLACHKTAGGHRRFARDDLERFLRAHAGPRTDEPRERWLELLERGGSYELRAALVAARGRLGAWHRVCDELGPALSALGARWECGEISVLEEHVTSERVARALAQASDALPVGEQSPVCLLACAEGDDHTLGLSLVELCLREAGWWTLWAGRRTPVGDILLAVERGEVGMVALSASSLSADAQAVALQAQRVEQACQAAGIPLALGGSGAWPLGLHYGQLFSAFEPFYRFAVGALERRLAG